MIMARKTFVSNLLVRNNTLFRLAFRVLNFVPKRAPGFNKHSSYHECHMNNREMSEKGRNSPYTAQRGRRSPRLLLDRVAMAELCHSC